MRLLREAHALATPPRPNSRLRTKGSSCSGARFGGLRRSGFGRPARYLPTRHFWEVSSSWKETKPRMSGASWRADARTRTGDPLHYETTTSKPRPSTRGHERPQVPGKWPIRFRWVQRLEPARARPGVPDLYPTRSTAMSWCRLASTSALKSESAPRSRFIPR